MAETSQCRLLVLIPHLLLALSLDAGSGTILFQNAVNGPLNLVATGASITLDGALGGTNALDAVSLTSVSGVALPAINATSILARTLGPGSDIALNGTLNASGTGDAITLVPGRNFVNTAGAGALSTPGGRWLVYSTSPWPMCSAG